MPTEFHEVQFLLRNRIVQVVTAAMLLTQLGGFGILALIVPSSGRIAIAVTLGVITGLELLIVLCVRMDTRLERSVVGGPVLRIAFAPFHRRTIPLAGIDAAEPVRYDPLADVGGWGIKWSRRFGRVYNLVGDRAVWITGVREPGSGEAGASYLIGTQRPEELAAAILADHR